MIVISQLMTVCVLLDACVTLQAGSEHVAFDKLCGLMPSVKYSGQSAKIPDGFQPADLLPGQGRQLIMLHNSLTVCL